MRTAAVLAVVLVLSFAQTVLAREQHPVEAARVLESAGEAEAAFLAWMAIDGAEHRAIRLARLDPERFLPLLGRTGPEVPRWRVKLLAGDLFLLLGEKDQALACYRAVADAFAGTDRYPVEPPRRGTHPVRPFGTGPGSHRDNWLIRRFLALDALPAAGREFDRIRKIHEPGEKSFYSGSGLLFTLDHAFFLLRTGREEEAYTSLAAPILLMDMDRVRGPFPGASRKKYIRLALGTLKEQGQSDPVVAAVLEQVGGGDTRALRVLAEIQRQQERMDSAIDLELRYLEKARIPEPGRSYREGLIYEGSNWTAEAALAFERVLTVPWSDPVLPAVEPVDRPISQQETVVFWAQNTEHNFKAGVLAKLERLYSALGRVEDMQRVLLLRHEFGADLISGVERLKSTAERFRLGGHLDLFENWAREYASKIERHDYRANLYFVIGDHVAAAREIAAFKRTSKWATSGYLQTWRELFTRAGEEPLRILLNALVLADPGDARSRLTLLGLDGDTEGEQAIEVMEEILTGKARYDYGRRYGKGVRIRFASPFSLALRLMRLYERHQRTDDIVKLGLLIAGQTPPFKTEDSDDKSRSLGGACLARAILHAGPAELVKLEQALAESPWTGALAQVRRRRAGKWAPGPAPAPFGWANLPGGVTAIAGNEFGLTLANDEKYVYAGHPWGIAVYDHQGEAVTRIALSDCALVIAAKDGIVWVGGTTGLFRVERDAWTVGHLRMDRHKKRRRPDRHHRDNRVFGLALDGDRLWIAAGGTVQVLDFEAMVLQVFADEDVSVEDRFIIEEDYVWTEGGSDGIYRYERSTETWTRVPGNHQDLELIGDVDGVLFGSVNLGDPIRRRPCIIDRETLAITPIFFEKRSSDRPILINHSLSFYGRLNGLPVFGAERPHLVYDPDKKRLREVADVWGRGLDGLESAVPRELLQGDTFRHPDGRITTDYTTVLTLENGTTVVGRWMAHSPRYKYHGEDWPFELFARGSPCGAGGLFFHPSDGPPRRVSSTPRSDSIVGNEVLCMARDDAGRTWLGTRSGVAVLDGEYRVRECFTKDEGLLGNRVSGVAALDGRVYFAGGWGAAGGGLMIFDLAKGVFTSRLLEGGLPTLKLRDVAADGDALVLTPDISVTKDNLSRWKHLHTPPFRFDPTSGNFTDPGPAREIGNKEAQKLARPEKGPPMPILDGFVISTHRIGDHDLIQGTRGLLVVPAGANPTLAIEEIEAPIIPDRKARLIADAVTRRPNIKTVLELRQALSDDNPWYRAAALRSAGNKEKPEFVPLAVQHLDDPVVRVRASALYVLTRIDESELVVPHLERVLSDPDPLLRAHATVHLCLNGSPPDASFLRDILERRNGYPPLPAGCRGTAGVSADEMEVYAAVAPVATTDIFAVLLDHPLGVDDYEPRQKARLHLGQSLAANPTAVAVLLEARTPDQIQFVRAVCGHAGRAILPALIEALTSDDRVVRSNAAIVCGAVGDPEAIPHLLTALDRESGLSRAGAVRSLGDLKAKEALPRLTELYLVARNDPGGGYRAGQADFGNRREYALIGSLRSIAVSFDELKASTLAMVPRPGAGERLLTPEIILLAIRKIGLDASQEFYLRLAGDQRQSARTEAAIGLLACDAAGRAEAVSILENLLMDADGFVRAEAGVSLALLDQESGRRAVLAWLTGTDGWAKERVLRALMRVTDGEQIAFALERIEEIRKDPEEAESNRHRARDILRNLGE